MDHAGPGVLLIERIDVSEHSVDARIRVADRFYNRTGGVVGLVARALSLLPGLAAHACENGTGAHVVAELADTESAHLLEHVAVELMVQAGTPRGLRAETSWDFSADGPGVYHVKLAYDVDLAALAALREAEAVCEWLLCADGSDPPDIEAAIARVRTARG